MASSNDHMKHGRVDLVSTVRRWKRKARERDTHEEGNGDTPLVDSPNRPARVFYQRGCKRRKTHSNLVSKKSKGLDDTNEDSLVQAEAGLQLSLIHI